MNTFGSSENYSFYKVINEHELKQTLPTDEIHARGSGQWNVQH
jgi:hypothetical protein